MGEIFKDIVKRVFFGNLTVLRYLLCAAFVLNRFALDEYGLVLGFVFIGCFLQAPILLGARVPYLLSLPYPRRRLIFLVGLLNYTCAAISAIFGGFYTLIVVLAIAFRVKGLSGLNIGTILRAIWGHLWEDNGGDEIHFLQDPNQLIVFLLCITVAIFFFGFVIQTAGTVRRVPALPMGQSVRMQAFKRVFVIFGVLPLLFWLFSKSTFLIVVFLFLILAAFALAPFILAWSFSEARASSWRKAFVGLALAQSLFVYVVAFHSVNHGTASNRLKSASLLGFLSPASGKELARSISSVSLTAEEASEFASLMNPSGLVGEKARYVWNAGAAPISLVDLLSQQKDEAAVTRLVRMYDPATLSENDFLATERIWSQLSGKSALFPTEDFWLGTPLSDALIVSWLSSETEHRVQIALRYAEFHPKPEFIPPIVQGLRKSYSGELIPGAVRVLSLLEGESLDLRTYLDKVRGGREARFWRVDCTRYKIHDLVGLTEKNNELLFRRCIREKAVEGKLRPELVASLWMESKFPLGSLERYQLEKAYREK